MFHLNKPVDRAVLSVKDGEPITLTADPGNRHMYTASMEMKETVRMTLNLRDREGRENKYPPELVVRVLPNQPPKLKMTGGGDVAVSPIEELTLGAEVRDDFGIKRAGISFTFAGQPQRNRAGTCGGAR